MKTNLLLTLVCLTHLATALAAADDPNDFVKRVEMIPMRDGARLKTIIVIPKGAHDAPIVLTRTPYNATNRTSRTQSPLRAATLPQMNDTTIAAGYIVVYQDIRGKYGSEGNFITQQPLRGPLNTGPTDPATDAYDTIDWLIHNLPESNGRVATMGGSYEGYTTLTSLVNAHPALKAAVAFAPMVDGWTGDDWFHHGAFRQTGMLGVIYSLDGPGPDGPSWWSAYRDTYEEFLRAGSAGAIAASHALERHDFWQKLLAHPAYDEFWQEQALDRVLVRSDVTVPLLIVAGLFDPEDIYGGPALFKALSARSKGAGDTHLVLGPWTHLQARREGRQIGPIEFEGDTAGGFRREVMQPFLDHYLKDQPAPDLPRVLAYETGSNRWQRYDAWPRSCTKGCGENSRSLFLRAHGRLDLKASTPAEHEPDADEYISDPAKPVPYRERPTLSWSAADSTWDSWLMDDQRFAASRPDVLVYETDPLTQPVRVAGVPMAHLFASTSATDADWVVKIIDVWPAQDVNKPQLGGYQWMISADIFRGRYRTDPAHPRAIEPGRVEQYELPLPNVNHTFLPGHRIMVQIQSTWFPLYDRNPQRYVPNIFLARPEDYVRATHRIWHAPGKASFIDLPVIP